MARRTLSLLLALLLVFSLSAPAFADVSKYVLDRSGDADARSVRVYIDSLLTLRGYCIGEKYYISAEKLLKLLDIQPDIQLDDKGVLTVNFEGFDFSCEEEDEFALVNYRYIPIPGGYRLLGGEICLPLEAYSFGLGVDFTVYESGRSISIARTALTPIEGEKGYYNKFHSDDVLWLSRIIYAEASKQCMEGKIGVGNVVLNRKEDIYFPDEIKDIIFDTANGVQFSAAVSGLEFTPTEQARVAAYMALDGINPVDDAEYFINQSKTKSTWHRDNLDFVVTIGDHDFYADRRYSQ